MEKSSSGNVAVGEERNGEAEAERCKVGSGNIMCEGDGMENRSEVEEGLRGGGSSGSFGLF